MKSKNKKLATPYERAQKKVKEIKGFYGHLAVYLIVVPTILFLAPGNARFLPVSNALFEDVNFLNWLDWNIYGTPILWGVGLAIHALSVFGKNPFLGKSWEERQIAKYMDRDNKEKQ